MTKANVALGNKRLLMLADYLESVDAIHRKKGEPTYNQAYTTWSCGAPACAMGHYVSMPHAKRRDVTFKDITDEFCINYWQKELLFAGWGCDNAKTAKQAAKYIRRFVKARQSNQDLTS